MTGEPPAQDPPKQDPEKTPDLLGEFKAQMQKEFADLKNEMDQKVKALSDENSQLKKDKEELQRALVRSATTDPPKEEPKKTEEELYKEHVTDISKRVLRNLGQKV